MPETKDSWRRFVEGLAADQIATYTRQPIELVSHANREASAVNGYRGRQILELIQNADDANENRGSGRLVLHLTRDALLAANTGDPFTERGVKSLVISDASPKQRTRNRFIGCKGLGFRSVLTWTQAPLVLSGPVRLCFSRDSAEATIRGLARGHPELQAEVAEFESDLGVPPVPIMRFPRWAEPSKLVDVALGFLQDGCTSVIALPFGPGKVGEEALREASSQIRALSPEAILFCRNLTEIRLSGDHPGGWTLERNPQDHGQCVQVHVRDTGESWTVYRREGKYPTVHPTGEPGPDGEYELAVAVPLEGLRDSPSGRLCVFFPTRTAVPIAPRLHATLGLTDDRNRLIQDDANRLVLGELARFFAEVIEQEASDRGGRHALSLVRGIEKLDPELTSLGFGDAVVRELGARKIFPRVSGGVADARDTRRPPTSVWADLIDPEVFPEVIDERGTDAGAALQLFDLGWFDPAELTKRLQLQMAGRSRGSSGELIGTLLRAEALGGVHVSDVLVATGGQHVGHGRRFFLHPTETGAKVTLPSWVTSLRMLDPEFQAGLLRGLGRTNVQQLSWSLLQAGAEVQVYGSGAVAKAVIRALDAPGLDGDKRRIRWKEALRWLHGLPRGDESWLKEVPVMIVTESGALAPANNLYLGRSYPRGEALHRLYGPLGRDEFAGSPDQVGMQGIDPAEVEAFLVALGVGAAPRMKDLDDVPRLAYVGMCLARQEPYPRSVRGVWCRDAASVRSQCWEMTCTGVQIPDRLLELLTRGEPESVVSYFLREGAALIASEEMIGGTFHARIGNERYGRPDTSVRLFNPLLWLMRETEWIPCRDGVRRRPRGITLARQNARLLEGLLWRHALRTDESQLDSTASLQATNTLLLRLGAVASLEGASEEAIYSLLQRLPELDPEGRHARDVYRTVASRDDLDGTSTAAKGFHLHGLVWSRTGGVVRYVPVSQARYNAGVSLPFKVESDLVLVDLPKDLRSSTVHAALGVKPLHRADLSQSIRTEGTKMNWSSPDADAALRRAVPFLYALRLYRRADTDEKEVRFFQDVRLHVCDRIHVDVQVLEKMRAEVMEEPGEAISIGTDLYVVGSYSPGTPEAFRLWSAVARLLADELARGFRAEALLILERESIDDMEEALAGSLGDEAIPKLEEARARLRLPVDDDTAPFSFPLPAAKESREPPPIDTTDGGGDGSVAEGLGIPGSPPERTTLSVRESIPPGPPGHRSRRELIVTAKSTAAPRNVRVMAPEDETFHAVSEFERHQDPPRYVVNVSHVRGSASFGCDLVSVASQEVRDRAERDGTLDQTDVLRFIEVKGRSQRTGDVELDENQLRRAEQLRDRFFLYRVFVDRARPNHYEIAVLVDPLHSDARKAVIRFDLAMGTDARWYELTEQGADEADGPTEA